MSTPTALKAQPALSTMARARREVELLRRETRMACWIWRLQRLVILGACLGVLALLLRQHCPETWEWLRQQAGELRTGVSALLSTQHEAP